MFFGGGSFVAENGIFKKICLTILIIFWRVLHQPEVYSDVTEMSC